MYSKLFDCLAYIFSNINITVIHKIADVFIVHEIVKNISAVTRRNKPANKIKYIIYIYIVLKKRTKKKKRLCWYWRGNPEDKTQWLGTDYLFIEP